MAPTSEALIRIQDRDAKRPTDETRFLMTFTPAGVLDKVTESAKPPPATQAK